MGDKRMDGKQVESIPGDGKECLKARRQYGGIHMKQKTLAHILQMHALQMLVNMCCFPRILKVVDFIDKCSEHKPEQRRPFSSLSCITNHPHIQQLTTANSYYISFIVTLQQFKEWVVLAQGSQEAGMGLQSFQGLTERGSASTVVCWRALEDHFLNSLLWVSPQDCLRKGSWLPLKPMNQDRVRAPKTAAGFFIAQTQEQKFRRQRSLQTIFDAAITEDTVDIRKVKEEIYTLCLMLLGYNSYFTMMQSTVKKLGIRK